MRGSMVCKEEGCSYPDFCKGWCRTHYMRQHRGADLNVAHRWMDLEMRHYVVSQIKAGRTLMDLAAETGYHHVSISKVFQKDVGMGVRQWKRENKS